MTFTLYAWANPLSAWRGADHTWVTTYPDPYVCPPPKDYWYCWGTCHSAGPATTARLLGSKTGSLAFASCICAPNNPSAHGGIDLYGVEGVCHQLANRILYATGTPPLTVSKAKMYSLSHLLYGAYGTTFVDWARRKKRCAAAAKLSAKVISGGSMNNSDLAVIDAKITERLGDKYSFQIRSQIHGLQFEMLNEKKMLDELVVTGQIRGGEFASRVNDLVSRYLIKIAELIGPENCYAIFDAEPGSEAIIVDPEIAENVDYSDDPDRHQ